MQGKSFLRKPSRWSRIAAYRDILYLAMLCLLVVVGMNSKLECTPEGGRRFFQAIPLTVGESKNDEMVKENDALKEELAAMNLRVKSLERELSRVNELETDRIQTKIREIQAKAAHLTSGSEREEEPEDAITATKTNQITTGEQQQSSPLSNSRVTIGEQASEEEGEVGNNVITGSFTPKEEEEEEEAKEEREGEQVDVLSATAELQEDLVADADVDTDDPQEGVTFLANEENEKLVEEEDDEDDDEDESEESESPADVPQSPKQFGYADIGGGAFRILPQVSSTSKKHFKTVGTKFLTLFRAFEHAGWKHRYEPTASASLYLTKPITKVPNSAGKMISQVSKSSCIGGTKGAQLRCKVKLAEKNGCKYTDLGISPMQFNLEEKADCQEFFRIATEPDKEKMAWIYKDGASYHGKRMKVFFGLPKDIKKRFSKCTRDKKSAGSIVMQYISNPMLFAGKKFDLRTYMLIASTKPFMVFFHNGFVRRSGATYDNSTFSKLGHITNHKVQDKQAGHFWSFEQLGEYLADEQGMPADFMSMTFRSYVKHATNYVFQAARDRLKRRSGAFMLFGLDWVMDTSGRVHFLEANGNPSIQNYEPTGLGPRIWNEMAELVTKLHREPDTLQSSSQELSVRASYVYGNWDLIFNEAEELVSGRTYNACNFPEYIKCQHPLKCPIW